MEKDNDLEQNKVLEIPHIKALINKELKKN